MLSSNFYVLQLVLLWSTGTFSSTISAVDHQLIKQNNNSKILKSIWKN